MLRCVTRSTHSHEGVNWNLGYISKFDGLKVSGINELKKMIFLNFYNPLLPDGNYSYRIIKISLSKKEGIKKKFPMSAASMSR